MKIGLSTLLHSESHAPPPGHPESAQRLAAAVKALSASPELVPFEAVPASRERILAVHLEAYLKQLEALARTGGGHYDADTYITPTSVEAAYAVSGAVVTAVKRAFQAEGPRQALVIGRPPGHHAESDRAMGFCLFNHVAVGAQYALDQQWCERVTIFDFDLHHGNGTQEIFYARDDVQYISTHQYPFYPGSGARNETGMGKGEGFTLNFPLAAGTGDRELLALMESDIVPAIESFGPGLIIISAGFDGHGDDPLGSLAFTAAGYEAVGRMLTTTADSVCDGRLLSVVEGGYNPEANQDSIISYVKGLGVS